MVEATRFHITQVGGFFETSRRSPGKIKDSEGPRKILKSKQKIQPRKSGSRREENIINSSERELPKVGQEGAREP